MGAVSVASLVGRSRCEEYTPAGADGAPNCRTTQRPLGGSMRSPVPWVVFLAVLILNASCSGGGKPEQDDSANNPQPEPEATTPETATQAPVLAAEPSEPAGRSEQNPVNQRPTDATLVVAGNAQDAGTYRASQSAQICGELKPEETATGERAFIVEFPADITPEITGIAFGSSKLVSGVTTTDEFRLTFHTTAKPGGAPARFAIDTVPPVPRYMGKGTATLSTNAGTDTLRVIGTNEDGESFDLTLVCRPRQG